MTRKRNHPIQLKGESVRAPARPILSIVVGTISTLFMLALTVPWIPVRGTTIGYFDFSWMLVLHEAVCTGRQFGPDLIVPYGPLGFLATNVYDPRTYLVLLTARVLLSLAAMHLLWEASKKLFPNPPTALPWLLAIIAMMGPGITAAQAAADTFDRRMLGGSEDHFFSICALLTLISYFSVHDRKVTRGIIAMIVLLAAASLAKVNFFMQDVVVVGAITIDQVLALRDERAVGRTFLSAAASKRTGSAAAAAGVVGPRPRAAIHNPGPVWRVRSVLVPGVYIASLAIFYFAARQSPASIGRFVWGWAEVTAGHMDAVGLPGNPVDVISYSVVAMLVLALAAHVEFRKWKWVGLLPVVSMAAVFALLYKHSFVRQDFAHATIAPMALFSAALFYAPAAWRFSRGRIIRGFCLMTVTLAGIVVWSSLLTFTDQGLAAYAWDTVLRTGDSLNAVAANLASPGRPRRQWEATAATVRGQNPLPLEKIIGPTDVYPHRQDVLLAYSLSYDPRPAFSSLFATAPALAELNAKHLQGLAAPETILFDIEPVDHQFPSLADGRSWPEILTRYDIVDAHGTMLVLRRRETPGAYRLVPLTTLTGRFDQAISISAIANAPLWARIRLHRRGTGRILSTLYKPPILWIEVQTRDHAIGEYRLLSSPAEHGFLLSPVVKDRSAFAALASGHWRTELASAGVDQITISVVDGSQDLNYDSMFTIELEELAVSMH